MKFLIAITLISFMYPTISYAQYNLKNIQEKFKENGAVLTPFSAPMDYAKVEEERQGPGWRYITKNETLFNNVIIYNHGTRGMMKIYEKFAKAGIGIRYLSLVGSQSSAYEKSNSKYIELSKRTDNNEVVVKWFVDILDGIRDLKPSRGEITDDDLRYRASELIKLSNNMPNK